MDDNSLKYISEWKSSAHADESARQFRFDQARDALEAVLSDLAQPRQQVNGTQIADGIADTPMQDVQARADGEVITIPLAIDDELADIPAEMRETVAQEIAAFRERSVKRDLERLRREEEMEAAERARNNRSVRATSPPTSAPAGRAGGANGIPLGPRERGVQGAPSGPKAFQGVQMPRDYHSGVRFVNGSSSTNGFVNREEDDDLASDEELERRRKARKEEELEKQYLDQERRWLNREKSRTSALEREKLRDGDEAGLLEKEREAMRKRLKEWNDDVEASRKAEEYYQDRSIWLRNRAMFRANEAEIDDRDRAQESRENGRGNRDRETAKDDAESKTDRDAGDIGLNREDGMPTREPARFKMSLGAAAQKAQAATAPRRRTAAEVEGLLEDEAIEEQSQKRTLVPIDPTKGMENVALDPEERAAMVQQLAREIPTSKDGLWSWPVRWESLSTETIEDQLKPFVEKKIVEYLGVQEQMLIDVVTEHMEKRGGPGELVELLEGALDDEAEALVRKLWRMIIFFSESERRGLNGGTQ